MALPLTPEEEARAAAYYGAPAPAPYQPNPGAPGYNPNPGAAVVVAPEPPPARAPLGNTPPLPTGEQGVIGRAFSSTDPLFQNPLASPPKPPGPAPIDLGDIDTVDLGDVDAPGFNPSIRQPTSFARGPSVSPPRPAGPGGRSGGAAGGKANPDPFGIGAANKHLAGTFGDQMRAREQAGGALSDKAFTIGEHQQEAARRMEEDAAIARAEEEYANQETQKGIDELSRQLDDVRSRKLEPRNMMDQGVGIAIGSIVASALGGLYAGMTGKNNPILEQLDRQVERQLAIDEKNLANEKDGIGQKMNLLKEQRGIFRDQQQAKDAARRLYYEAAKQAIEGEAQQYDSAIYKANAAEAVTEIDRGLAGLEKQLAEQQRAQAAAAAAQAMAQRREVTAAYNRVWDMVFKETNDGALAEAEAKRQIAVTFYPERAGARPDLGHTDGGMGKSGREEIAKERAKAQQEVGANLASIRRARGDLDAIVAGGPVGNAVSGAPAWVPGIATARKNVNSREAYNMGVRLAIGAGYRLRTGGMEPKNAEMIHELEQPFRIEPSDDAETAKQKMDLLERYLVESGAAKGTEATTTEDSTKAANARLGAKPVGR